VAIAMALISLVSALFARAIAGPMHAITNKAKAVAAGHPQTEFALRGFTPAEIRTLSEALDVMTKKLRAQAEYVADFATTVSHELKTPIAAIRGASELLSDFETMDSAQRQRFLHNILLDTERMDRLVTRLLTLAKIESAAALPSPSVQVVPFVERLVRRYGDGVSLVLRDPPAELSILEDHLASAIGNLVDNAVRHGQGQPVEVTLGAAPGGRLLVSSRSGSGDQRRQPTQGLGSLLYDRARSRRHGAGAVHRAGHRVGEARGGGVRDVATGDVFSHGSVGRAPECPSFGRATDPIVSARTPSLATFADLAALGDGAYHEILAGQLVQKATPLPEHGLAQSALSRFIGGPFHHDDGHGGPGGWWILTEVEVELAEHEVVRPDVVGWRRQRLPAPWGQRPLRVVPDWVCEVLSPSDERRDRVYKASLYARSGVGYYWLVAPRERLIEAFQLQAGAWLRLGAWQDTERARIAPFEAIELDLSRLFPPPE